MELKNERDPAMIKALEEIREIVRKNDLGAFIMIASRDQVDFAIKIDPSWSCAHFESEDNDPNKAKGLRFRSLKADYGGDESKQKAESEYTIGMFLSFYNIVKTWEENFGKIVEMLGKHIGFIEHVEKDLSFVTHTDEKPDFSKMKKVMPGLYMDPKDQSIHMNPEEACKELGLDVTEANVELVNKCMLTATEKAFKGRGMPMPKVETTVHHTNEPKAEGKCPFNHGQPAYTPATEPRPELPPMPPRIAKLPLDARGYVIPFFAAYPNGVPDHRVADPYKREQAVKEDLCWVCGEKLGKHKTFVIGPMCSINRTTAEPPSHLECAEWSAKGCPFLSRPNMDRRENNTEGHVPADGIMIKRNPGVTCLWTTTTYSRFADGMGGWLIRIGDPIHFEFYREGRKATRAEIEESVRTGIPNLEAVCQDDDDRKALKEATDKFLDALKDLP